MTWQAARAVRTALAAPALAALVLAAAGGLLPAATYAQGPTPSPSPTRSVNDDAPAQILVRKLAPRAPMDPAEFFQVTGTILNRGSQPLHELTVRLRRGERLASRGQLATADADPPATGTRVGATPVRAAVQDLAPGATTTFDIRVRVSELLLGAIGVYPLQVEARARFGDAGSTGPVGRVQTYVPWFPDGPPRGRIRIAWLWPLVDQPRRGPGEVMLDDTLRTSFQRGGRLDRMLRSAADGQKGGCDQPADPPPTLPRPARLAPCRADSVPVTYAVDPDLLFTAEALGSPYQLLGPGNTPRRVDDTGPARSWLAALRTASAGGDVLSLPYADPDVVALTTADVGLADEVTSLRELGRSETTRILGRPPLTSVVWPPAGRLTRRAVESLTSGGATAVAVDPIALPPPDREPFPTPATTVGRLPTSTGRPAVLTIEPTLSALLSAAPTDYPGDRIVEQRWLVETAMIAAESPSLAPRTLLVAPPRRADLHTAVAADALRDTGRLPWLCPVSLASVASGTDACPDEVRPPAPAQPPVTLEPQHAGDPALSDGFLAQVRDLRRTSMQFTDEVLAVPTSTEAAGTNARLTRARARTESAAWRDHPEDGQRMVDLLRADLDNLRNKVHLQVGGGTVTLTSSTGVISVNVVNELQQPVLVGVVLDARNRARLSTSGTPVATVRPESAAQINLKVTAQTSGSFPVIAQLVDRTGRDFGPPVQLVVRSTQYGRVALAVTGIGAGVLLFAAGLRIVRRALRRAPA